MKGLNSRIRGLTDPLAPSERAAAIRLRVERFAGRLARQFPQAFADGRRLKKEVIRWMRSALPPHPGRPRKPTVTRAYALKHRGTPWRDIYRECIPRYDTLKWEERRLEIRRLRNAYRSRLRLAREHRGQKCLTYLSRGKELRRFSCAHRS